MTQILIEVPDYALDHIKAGAFGSIVEAEIIGAVRRGVVLPKGHGDLKDADKLAIAIAMKRDRCDGYGNQYERALFEAYDISVDEIIDAPTIIEADKESEDGTD